MPTKFLIVESDIFQLGANAGEGAERIDANACLERLKGHLEACKAGSTDLLFVLCPSELKQKAEFVEATKGGSFVSIAFCRNSADALHILPVLPLLSNQNRTIGAKAWLKKGSTVFSESFFSAKAAGSRLDACFHFARSKLSAETAAKAWASLQALVFLGIQNLPKRGEESSGEKVSVQLGADEKILAFTVRFDLSPTQLPALQADPILALPRAVTTMMEMRFLEAERQIEFSCLFFRNDESMQPIELQSFHQRSGAESEADASDYIYKSFESLDEENKDPRPDPAQTSPFKKKFSALLKSSPGEKIEMAKDKENSSSEIPVSGNASIGGDFSTILKNEGALSKIADLEEKSKKLEAAIRARDEIKIGRAHV